MKHITREEIISILNQDAYYRKIENWPLLTSKNIIGKINLDIIINGCFFCNAHNRLQPYNLPLSYNKITVNIENQYPFSQELLIKFKGHLVACGGAVVKGIINNYRCNGEDIDLFCYDLNIEEANSMRLDVIQFLCAKWKKDGIVDVTITRNQFVTTVYVYDFQDEEGYDSGEYAAIHTYQIIHRIYPNISSILGGFDLSASMFAYDGEEIYTIPIGLWSLQNMAIIIDTKRRSTSFEYRLCKYYERGFNLIFPGLPKNIIKQQYFDYDRNNPKMEQLLKLMVNLAHDHGYSIIREDFLRKDYYFDEDIKDNFHATQIEENILPLLNLSDGNNFLREICCYEPEDANYKGKIRVGIKPYDKENIEERFIKKISDYAHDHMFARCFPSANAARLRMSNLDVVVSILNNPTVEDLLDDIVHPNLGFDEQIVTQYRNKTMAIRYGINTRGDKFYDVNSKYYFYQLSKCFGKLTVEVIKIRETDQYNDYVNLMIETMRANNKICQEKLIGIKWITQNPERQWTSSINPIIADPRDWYGKHYVPVITGIPPNIETCLRLARLRSIWSSLPDDIFNVILLYLWGNYANDAFQYL